MPREFVRASLQTDIHDAPNPGFVCAIEAAKAPVMMLASLWLFTSHFSTLKGGRSVSV